MVLVHVANEDSTEKWERANPNHSEHRPKARQPIRAPTTYALAEGHAPVDAAWLGGAFSPANAAHIRD